MSQKQLSERLKLEHLPIDIISPILSFNGMSRAVIRLWTSGSPAMRRLVKSTKVMHFESHLELDFALLPSILGELSSLRSLTIDRGSYRLIGISKTLNLLQTLSPTLEQLILLFDSSVQLCSPGYLKTQSPAPRQDSQTTEKADNTYLDLAKCFPRLQWLEFGTSYKVSCGFPQILPSTLTRLVGPFKVQDSSTSYYIPPLVTHLTAYGAPTHLESFFEALPRSLEHLDLSAPGNDSLLTIDALLALPRSLKALKISPKTSINWSGSTYLLHALPPTLEVLTNIACNLGDLTHLLPTLKTLHFLYQTISISPAQVRQLSRSMTSLQLLFLDYEDLSKDDFPPSLTHLQLEGTFGNFYVPLLPFEHLRSLNLEFVYLSCSFIKQFPPKLTRLTLLIVEAKDGNEVVEFPPFLEHLNLTIERFREMDSLEMSLPQTLTSLGLTLPKITIGNILALPLCLCSLHLKGSAGHLVSTFMPPDADMIAKIELLRRSAEAKGVFADETLPARQPREFGLFDLLPRTLTYLKIDGSAEFDDATWHSLPKKLETLMIVSPYTHYDEDKSAIGAPLPCDYIPFESVTTQLLLDGATLEDRHFKRLNPRLQVLTISRGSKMFNNLEACLPWIPRQILLECGNGARQLDYQSKRRSALYKLDRQGFHALNAQPSHQ